MQHNVLILGGYGNTGALIAKLLLQESNVQLVIAGRDSIKGQHAAQALNHEFQTDRVSSKPIDAANIHSLAAAFEGIDIVVIASSTLEHVRNVSTTALEAGADYLDVQLSSPGKLAVLEALREDIKRAGNCFITDGGFHPGVPSAMVRYAATQIDTLETATVSAAFQLNWRFLQFSESTLSEFMDELGRFHPQVFQNKKWVNVSVMKTPKVNFGTHFGERYCMPMFLEELRSLPKEIPSLNELGFYISGFNGVTDYIVMPIALAMSKIFGETAKRLASQLFSWSLKTFSQPPFGAVIQLEAKGVKETYPSNLFMRISHDDAYVLTAASAVACLLQYLNGSIRHPGLWSQANLVEPIRFFNDIQRLGIKVIECG